MNLGSYSFMGSLIRVVKPPYNRAYSKTGRPRRVRKTSEYIGFRISEDEKKRIERYAAAANKSLSDFCRDTLLTITGKAPSALEAAVEDMREEFGFRRRYG